MPLKLASSHPEEVVVYAAEFSGDQSLAARQVLGEILRLRPLGEPKLGLGLTRSLANSSIDDTAYYANKTKDPLLSLEVDSNLNQLGSNQLNSVALPELDESNYPYRLSTGELVSFSHSGSRVLVAIAPSSYQTLGVDTELKPVTLKLAERFFTPNELQIIESAQHQLDTTQRQLLRQAAWMIKEAHGKAAGLNLFAAIAFDLSPVLNQVLIALDQSQNSGHGDWTTEHGEFVFSGNLLDRWALCLS